MAYFQSVRVPLWLSLLVFLTGCSSVAQHTGGREKNYYTPAQEGVVMLSPREGGEPANDQPVTVVLDHLEALLADLFYLEARDGLSGLVSDSRRRIPLIQAANLAGLSLALSRALADASTGEDVVVGLKQPRRDSIGSIEGYRLTALRVFVVDNRLNLLFGAVGENLDHSYRFATVHRQARTEDFPIGISSTQVQEKAGSRGTVADAGNRVLYSGGEENVQRLRDDWIALDLNPGTAKSAASFEQSPQAKGRNDSSSVVPGPGGREQAAETTRSQPVESDPEEAVKQTKEWNEKLLRKEVIPL